MKNCTDNEWKHCRVEKMGCSGCHYDDTEDVTLHGEKAHLVFLYFINEEILPHVMSKGETAILVKRANAIADMLREGSNMKKVDNIIFEITDDYRDKIIKYIERF